MPAHSSGTVALIREHTNHSSHRSFGSECRRARWSPSQETPPCKAQLRLFGPIACGHCGSSIVGEIKKQRYIYYHCTGYKGRCDEAFVREEVLERQFPDLLGQLSFDDEALAWVRESLHASHADVRREHEGAIKRLQTEHKRLQNRLDAMYVDKLDGKIDATFYERMSTSWREEQTRCLREIEQHQAANKSYMDEGVRLLELARNARCLWEGGGPRKAATPQFPGFELLVEERGADRHPTPTF